MRMLKSETAEFDALQRGFLHQPGFKDVEFIDARVIDFSLVFFMFEKYSARLCKTLQIVVGQLVQVCCPVHFGLIVTYDAASIIKQGEAFFFVRRQQIHVGLNASG